MGAKVNCKKGYNTPQGYVEFKSNDRCPVSDSPLCERCNAKDLPEGKKFAKTGV